MESPLWAAAKSLSPPQSLTAFRQGVAGRGRAHTVNRLLGEFGLIPRPIALI